jgi:glycosyltransferase involved in cell wall biosynthesis
MEVIVADNASTDDSLIFLQQHYPSIRIIKNQKNEGFAEGYNLALRQVEAKYYVLLNSDVEVEAGWLEPMVSLMEANEKIGACQPKLRAYDQREYFEYAGACGGWIDNWGYPFSRGRVFDVCEKDYGQYEDAAPCFWATGAALMIRSTLYHELGGLDPYFFAHQDMSHAYIGLQIINPKILNDAPSKCFSISHYFYNKIAENGLLKRVEGVELLGEYFHIGNVDAITETENKLNNQNN